MLHSLLQLLGVPTEKACDYERILRSYIHTEVANGKATRLREDLLRVNNTLGWYAEENKQKGMRVRLQFLDGNFTETLLLPHQLENMDIRSFKNISQGFRHQWMDMISIPPGYALVKTLREKLGVCNCVIRDANGMLYDEETGTFEDLRQLKELRQLKASNASVELTVTLVDPQIVDACNQQLKKILPMLADLHPVIWGVTRCMSDCGSLVLQELARRAPGQLGSSESIMEKGLHVFRWVCEHLEAFMLEIVVKEYELCSPDVDWGSSDGGTRIRPVYANDDILSKLRQIADMIERIEVLEITEDYNGMYNDRTDFAWLGLFILAMTDNETLLMEPLMVEPLISEPSSSFSPFNYFSYCRSEAWRSIRSSLPT